MKPCPEQVKVCNLFATIKNSSNRNYLETKFQDKKIDLGDLMVSLSYLPSAERLTVVLIKARNLRVVDDSRNSSDPYVKVSLIHNGKKIKKRKSGVYRNTVCPVFNEALTFDISKDILKTSLIEFLVMHDSLLGKIITAKKRSLKF